MLPSLYSFIIICCRLLASGQNSTITGTLTGQVIMEGFVHMKMPLWARRLVTRLISVIPVLICVAMTGRETTIQQHTALNLLMEKLTGLLGICLTILNAATIIND